MNEEKLNMEVRRFLKKVGITSQREIENTIIKAIEAGRLAGSEALDIKMTLELPALDLKHVVEDRIAVA